jgi:molecular chaperone GrpE
VTDGDAVNTESVNDSPAASADSVATAAESADAGAGAESPAAENLGAGSSGAENAAAEHPDTALAAQRLDDLQRLNAEYVNYKRRVDRDRALVQERAIHDVLESLLPVLDDIHAAREHGDLAEGPFAAIADKLESGLGKYGLQRFGAIGEAFDPSIHEALMHAPWPEGDEALAGVDTEQGTTIVMVLQPGYRSGEFVLRPARVSVADPA